MRIHEDVSNWKQIDSIHYSIDRVKSKTFRYYMTTIVESDVKRSVGKQMLFY
jgi:hypothetical protein